MYMKPCNFSKIRRLNEESHSKLGMSKNSRPLDLIERLSQCQLEMGNLDGDTYVSSSVDAGVGPFERVFIDKGRGCHAHVNKIPNDSFST